MENFVEIFYSLVGNLCQLGAHQIQVSIDRCLVILINLWQGEQRDKG